MNRAIRAIGAPMDRIDGPKKVTGTATFSFEYPVEGVTYAFPVQSTIAKGRIVSIDASAARALPGSTRWCRRPRPAWRRGSAAMTASC